MRFNWVDLFSIGIVASSGAVQFLRGTKGLSRVFYEALFLIGALVAATRLLEVVYPVVPFPPYICFAGMFVIVGALGILLAALVNRLVPFDAGPFNYLFVLLFAVACGWVVGHAALRSLYIALAHRSPEFLLAVRRSWMASQLLYFGAFWELLAVLRFARYTNVPQ